jgi:hypothetical protein
LEKKPMSRQLKPQIVDEVKSPNGLVALPIYFDRNEKDFFVEVTGPNDRVRADSVTEVKKLAQESLVKATSYKWEGILAIEMEGSYDDQYKTPGTYNYRGRAGFGAKIKFEFHRMERSPHPTRPGTFVYRPHTLDFEATERIDSIRKRREENLDLQTYGCSLNATILPYDEETWAGLHAMKRAVDDAHAKLAALLERKDLADKLRLVGKQAVMPILPSAVGEERKRR